MKKVISIFMLVCMILTMIPVSVVADTVSAEPALQTPPADATVVDHLEDLVAMKDGGVFTLNADLHITFEMIDEVYATEVEGQKVSVITKTEVKDAEGNPVTDGEGNPTYEYSYVFAAPIVNVSKTTCAFDETTGAALPFILYGNGHSITFEEGVTFSNVAVLANKTVGHTQIYDVTFGSAANPIIMNTTGANVAVIASGSEDVTNNMGTKDDTSDDVKTVARQTVKNVDVYAEINDGRNNNNNVSLFIAKVVCPATFEDCNAYGHVKGDLTLIPDDKEANQRQYGGFVATYQKAADETDPTVALVIKNCNNYADIGGTNVGKSSAKTASAGFVGAATTGVIEITNCTNYGTIISVANAAGFAGHIAGDITLDNCVNEGEIKQITAMDGKDCTAAGLVGCATSKITIKNSKNNTTEVTAEKTTAAIGGLYANATTATPDEDIVLENNYSFCAADLSMTIGAAVKIDAPTNLMFQAKLSAAFDYDTLIAKYGEANVKFGMYIAKAEDVAAAGSMEALVAADATKVTDAAITWDADKTGYTATTADIAAADYTTDYAAVAYVTVKEGTETKVLYSAFNADDNVRNVNDVAYAATIDRETFKFEFEGYTFAMEDGTFSCYSATVNEKLAAYVVEPPVEETPSEGTEGGTEGGAAATPAA